MNISFSALALPRAGSLVVAAMEGGALCKTAAEVDKKCGGAITRAIKAGRFEGKSEQALELLSPAGLEVSRVLVVGLGKPAEIKALSAEKIGALIIDRLAMSGEKQVTVAVDDIPKAALKAELIAAHIAAGAHSRSYRFDKYRTKMKENDKPSLTKIIVMSPNTAAAKSAFTTLAHVLNGVFAARDLVNEPANALYPAEFAKRARALGKLGLKVEVLNEAQMAKLGMGAILAVGQGSSKDSQLVVLHWKGAPKSKKPPVALVGKGVCFDSGGISLKPGAGMGDMKGDMGGAAAVFGAMAALAGRRAKANVIGVLACVENMPGPDAQRPGDIITSMSGQTIEVLNTDAEGRLVLADAMTYVQRKYKPRAVIDLATLTGAITIALGDAHAGLFSNQDALCAQIDTAGKAVGETVWRMPMGSQYDSKIKSKFADMQNISNAAGAGSITAAQFLLRFIENDTPWAHLDIAGVAWTSDAKPSWGSGYGVRLLDRLIADNYEE
ncbi:MAG: leucyl aminopeptidase [Alphaproteobacteria bacterium]